MSTALYLGIGGGVLLLIIIIVVVMMSGKKDKDETTPTTTTGSSTTTTGSSTTTTGSSTNTTNTGSSTNTTNTSSSTNTTNTTDEVINVPGEQLKVLLCDDIDYKPPCVGLSEGNYNTNQMGIPKNKVSSIKIPNGLVATLFWNENFGEPKVTIRSDIPDLKNFPIKYNGKDDNWNNELASIKIMKESSNIPKATFCDGINYASPCVQLGKGDYNTSEMGIPKNKISSVKVPSGMNVTLFWNENFEGKQLKLTSDVPDLRNNKEGSDNWNDETASIKIS